MENKDLYKITTSSENTTEKLTITVKMDLLKINQNDEDKELSNIYLELLSALHLSLLSTLENLCYYYRKFPHNMQLSKHSYFSHILKDFSIDDLREIRSVMLNKSL